MTGALRIYLACTVRGDRSRLARVRRIRDRLEALGHTVITTHLLDDDVEAAEARLTDREVFERDLRWLEAADAVVAEASGSSFGVGFEVGYTLARSSSNGRRALVLYDRSRRGSISRMIAGITHPGASVVAYDSDAEIDEAIDAAFGRPAAGRAG